MDSADQSVESRNAEFGAATQARRDHLRKQGLLGTDDVRLSEEVMGRLRSQELVCAASNVSKWTGQREASLQTGKALEGRLQSTIDLGQGRLGVVGNGKEFVLVPWRRDLGQYFGREITVAKTGQGITWTMGVDRSIGMSR